MHFCESMATFGAKCSCARGYRLMQDGLDCEPEGIDVSVMKSLLNITTIMTLKFHNVTPPFSHHQLNSHVVELP